MKEWTDSFNSFNSGKGLTYIEYYRAIDEWRLGTRKKPLPPIEISLDLFAFCQLHCSHCNFGKYLSEDDTATRRMTDEHLFELINFFGSWKEEKYRVRGICFGGGGESTLHTGMSYALELSKSFGMDNSIATNGLNIKEDLLSVIPDTCKWVGISVDAATKETYNKGRKGDYFELVLRRISDLVNEVKRRKSACSVSYKFLIFDYNQHEIFEACKIAKSLGVRDFHCRPANFTHQGMSEKFQVNPYDVKFIEKQFEKCRELETKEFRVFTVVHKFKKDFTPLRNFSQCWASPICLQICPIGDSYLCPDTRQLEFFRLGTTKPEDILKFWGSEEHYKLVFETGCKNCFSRCTFSPYNEQCERLAINKDDPMDLSFV